MTPAYELGRQAWLDGLPRPSAPDALNDRAVQFWLGWHSLAAREFRERREVTSLREVPQVLRNDGRRQ